MTLLAASENPGFICHRCVHRIDGPVVALGDHYYEHLRRRNCHTVSGWLIRLRWKLTGRA